MLGSKEDEKGTRRTSAAPPKKYFLLGFSQPKRLYLMFFAWFLGHQMMIDCFVKLNTSNKVKTNQPPLAKSWQTGEKRFYLVTNALAQWLHFVDWYMDRNSQKLLATKPFAKGVIKALHRPGVFVGIFWAPTSSCPA